MIVYDLIVIALCLFLLLCLIYLASGGSLKHFHLLVNSLCSVNPHVINKVGTKVGTKCTSRGVKLMKRHNLKKTKKPVLCIFCIYRFRPTGKLGTPLCGHSIELVHGVVRDIIDIKGFKLCLMQNKNNNCRYFTRFDFRFILLKNRVIRYMSHLGGDDGKVKGYSLEDERTEVKATRAKASKANRSKARTRTEAHSAERNAEDSISSSEEGNSAGELEERHS